MSTTRVWNVTNDPKTDVPAQNLMVLGKLLKPGQSVQVDEKDLDLAHKLMKSAAGKLLAIGKETPAYLEKGAKAKLAAGVPGHGVPVAPVEPEPKKEEPRAFKRKG